jgi:hypothetical protein
MERHLFAVLVKGENLEAIQAACARHELRAPAVKGAPHGNSWVTVLGSLAGVGAWLAEDPVKPPYPDGAALWFKEIG